MEEEGGGRGEEEEGAHSGGAHPVSLLQLNGIAILFRVTPCSRRFCRVWFLRFLRVWFFAAPRKSGYTFWFSEDLLANAFDRNSAPEGGGGALLWGPGSPNRSSGKLRKALKGDN